MKHPFLLWLALLFSLLTATSRADHFKGGSLSWTRLTAEPGFKVRADVAITFDLSSPTISPVDTVNTPKVNGMWVYTGGMAISAACELDWGDDSPTSGVTLSQFEVVDVDFAAQLVTVKATSASQTTHEYQASGDYTIEITGGVRDDGEELANANRQGKIMRLISSISVNLATPSTNAPPAFNPQLANLIIIDRANPSFPAPVAVDPDGDTVKYTFHLKEMYSTKGAPITEDSWEVSKGLTITDSGQITWAGASALQQLIDTYAIQVVAKDYSPGSSTPKSSSVKEFQVWVNTPNQPGYPEIGLAPNYTSFTAIAGQPFRFSVLGTDEVDPSGTENSRLNAVVPALDMPAGAIWVPSGGFSGLGGHHAGHHGSKMEAVFYWVPPVSDVGTTKTLHLTVVDEDGKVSPEKVVTITVAPANTLNPLQLTVNPSGTVDQEFNRFTIEPGEQISLTLTGSCATSSVPLQLFTLSEIPHEANVSPALPVNGFTTVQTTFTWTPTVDDCTPLDQPHYFDFRVADTYGREVERRVAIHVLPDAPIINFMPSGPTSIVTDLWVSQSLQVRVAGGTLPRPNLTISALDAGFIVDPIQVGPGVATFQWRVMPGQVPPSGFLRLQVEDELQQKAILQVPVTINPPAGNPAWWATNNVLTGGPALDFGMANQGQLKAITAAAYNALLAADPDMAENPRGEALATYVTAFSTTTGNYHPATQGQAKNAAVLVYEALGEFAGGKSLGLPWTSSYEDDESFAPVAVGQLKTLFSFPTPTTSLFNDLPYVEFTGPVLPGNYDNRDTVPLSAKAQDDDGSIVKVEFFAGSTLLGLGSIAGNGDYTLNWSPTVAGTYAVKAKAYDDDGATSETVVSITISEWADTPSTITFTSPNASSDFESPAIFDIAITASDVDGPIQSVSFYADNVLQGVDNTPPYSVPMNQIIARGSHSVKAVVKDVFGTETTQQYDFLVTAPSTSGSPVTAGLAEGTNYSGMVDTYIEQSQPNLGRGSSTELLMTNGSSMRSALLKWDLSMFPTNAVVTSVTLELSCPPGSQPQVSLKCRLFAVKREWTEQSATWVRASDTNWDEAGVKDTQTDRESVVLGTYEAAARGQTYAVQEVSPLLRDKVQQWITNPSQNLGFSLQQYSQTANWGTGILSVYSSEAALLNKRPKLSITYYIPTTP